MINKEVDLIDMLLLEIEKLRELLLVMELTQKCGACQKHLERLRETIN